MVTESVKQLKLKKFFDDCSYHPFVKNIAFIQKRGYTVEACLFDGNKVTDVAAVYRREYNGRWYKVFVVATLIVNETWDGRDIIYNVCPDDVISSTISKSDCINRFKNLEKAIDKGRAIVDSYIANLVDCDDRLKIQKEVEGSEFLKFCELVKIYGYKCEGVDDGDYHEDDMARFEIYKDVYGNPSFKFDADDKFEKFWINSFSTALTRKQFVEIVRLANGDEFYRKFVDGYNRISSADEELEEDLYKCNFEPLDEDKEN